MTAYIIFSTNNLPGSVLIRAGTWSQFSHVDLICGDGKVVGALALHGVAEQELTHRIVSSTRWAIYEVNADQASVEAFVRSQIGKSYDWLGCIGIAAHRDWQGGDKWFCSELIAAAFLHAGTPLVNPSLRMNRVTPETLLRSPLLTLVASSDTFQTPSMKGSQ